MFKLGTIKKKSKTIVISSPMSGTVIPISQVGDPTFSANVLGSGIAIIPTSERIVAPANAYISLMIETGHAVVMIAEGGVELLIHIGIDTVKLKGDHFTAKIVNDDFITPGKVLVKFDAEAIKKAGFDLTTSIVVCNPEDFADISFASKGTIKEGDPLIYIKK